MQLDNAIKDLNRVYSMVDDWRKLSLRLFSAIEPKMQLLADCFYGKILEALKTKNVDLQKKVLEFLNNFIDYLVTPTISGLDGLDAALEKMWGLSYPPRKRTMRERSQQSILMRITISLIGSVGVAAIIYVVGSDLLPVGASGAFVAAVAALVFVFKFIFDYLSPQSQAVRLMT